MKPVGYLLKYKEGMEGERGMYYDYVLASNGLFIEAEGKLMAARVPVTLAQVRGLSPLETKVVLRYGKIPQRFFDLALSVMLADINKEHYVAITWKDGYHIHVPSQEASAARVEYSMTDSVILDLHSHPKMVAKFSPQDNQDETGLKLYGVVGKLTGTPKLRLRAGVYGYFYPICWSDIFEGTLEGVDDLGDEPDVIDEEEEVIVEDELQSSADQQPGYSENRSGRMRWHWWLRGRRPVPAHD